MGVRAVLLGGKSRQSAGLSTTVHPGTAPAARNAQHRGPLGGVAGVSATIESKQKSTAASIVGPLPVSTQPPGGSALAIASSNFLSAFVRHNGSTATASHASRSPS